MGNEQSNILPKPTQVRKKPPQTQTEFCHAVQLCWYEIAIWLASFSYSRIISGIQWISCYHTAHSSGWGRVGKWWPRLCCTNSILWDNTLVPAMTRMPRIHQQHLFTQPVRNKAWSNCPHNFSLQLVLSAIVLFGFESGALPQSGPAVNVMAFLPNSAICVTPQIIRHQVSNNAHHTQSYNSIWLWNQVL